MLAMTKVPRPTFGDRLDISRESMLMALDEEANSDSLKEGTNFFVGEGNSSPYELETFIAFLLSRHLFEGYL